MKDKEINDIIRLALKMASELSGRCASEVYINLQDKVFNRYKAMKKITEGISPDEFSKLPAYIHCCYEQKIRNGKYYIAKTTKDNLKSMLFFMSNQLSFADFYMWIDENKIFEA